MNAASWQAIRRTYRVDEAEAVAALTARIRLDEPARRRIADRALALAREIRRRAGESSGAEAFLRRFGLSSREGVVLMCLAEALLRIPDAETQDELIRDKLSGTQWESEARGEGGLLLNAATWGLMLTGTLTAWADDPRDDPAAIVRRLVARAGEPFVRRAVRQAMKIMAEQFIVGETIEDAIERAAPRAALGYRFSYDMLGEAARTAADADRYFGAYEDAIEAVGRAGSTAPRIEDRPGISIKLSALHPRYEVAQEGRVFGELLPRLETLAARAVAAGVPVTLDAEEADRLELSLELFERLARDPALAGWDGLGLAVQAYQKRAVHVCDWLVALAHDTRRRLMVRLVKGAYWDTEVKLAQVLGLEDYPVFTRKQATDVSYIACAQTLLAAGERIFPQFATHNSHSVATVLECAAGRRDLEFQKLHGMGDALYDALVPETGIPCRVYAPVGGHRDLLAYLVRRLLENGANSSFVHQVGDPDTPLERLVADPIEALPRPYTPHPRVPKPRFLLPDRLNSRGVDLSDRAVLERLTRRIAADRAAATPRHCRTRHHRARRPPPDRRGGAGYGRSRARRGGALGRRGVAGMGCDAGGRACAHARARGRAAGGDDRRADIAVRPRSGEDAARCGRGGTGSSRLLPLLCGARPRRLRRADSTPRSDRRVEPARARGARRLRMHQSLELPACHLHRSGQCRADGGQRRGRKAGGADAADRRARRGGFFMKRASHATCCTSSPARARQSARRSSAIRSSPASRSPARTRRRARSTRRSPRATGRSCRSSPRPAG